jgi:Tfp pilus assembly protein PilP
MVLLGLMFLTEGACDSACAAAGGAAASTQVVEHPSALVPKKSAEEILKIPFTYRRENRPDPFLPFLTEKTGPTQVAQEEETPLAGMQLFEPGQLTLVAILFSGQQAIAMVEDSTGMGHILRVKDKIGRRGEVKAIVPNTVVIEESTLTTSGSRRITTNEMVLRKEGDKE